MKKMKQLIAFFAMRILGGLEKILFRTQRASNLNSEISVQGFSFADDSLINVLDLDIESHHSSQQYYVNKILTRESINNLAQKLLTSDEVRRKLSSFFDGSFCIGFISYYETSALPIELEGKSVYANHWHLDTLLTENSVKIMLLPNTITVKQGPLQIFSKRNTMLLRKNGFIRGGIIPENLLSLVEPITFLGDISRAIFARTHVCMHTAGVPESGHSREQIMIQLNPSRTWGYHKDLYEKQFEREPTMPLLKNIFRPKINVSI